VKFRIGSAVFTAGQRRCGPTCRLLFFPNNGQTFRNPGKGRVADQPPTDVRDEDCEGPKEIPELTVRPCNGRADTEQPVEHSPDSGLAQSAFPSR